MNFIDKLRAAAEALVERITSNNAVHNELVAFVNEAHAAIAALEQRLGELEATAVRAATDLLPGLPIVSGTPATPATPPADNAGSNGAQS
ncbi:hypothetical protein GJQ57_21015 [Ralstonia pickettii]|uniref:Uncharacterized protein n=1 Tax=Ralstonia pickettii TaxID=329 RepID=A0A7X2HR95_RALPI|nr:hypothetical protein [Ralstonia pickettii]MRT01132.1 hypothetical protein [Ralstonia pickettii]